MGNVAQKHPISTSELRDPKVLGRYVRAHVKEPFPGFADIRTGMIKPDPHNIQLRKTREEVRKFILNLLDHNLEIQQIEQEVEGVTHPHEGSPER